MCVGETIGGYRVLGELGEGGVAKVYRAEPEDGGDEVALKILKPEAMAQQNIVASFQYEVRVLSRLAHPGIMGIHGSGAANEQVWAAVELVEGTPFDEYLKKHGKVSQTEAANHGIQLLDALAHLHTSGYVHRDLKPANLMLTADGRLVLMDFGTVVKAGAKIDYETGLYGTVPYLSPEQVTQHPKLDDRSDLYAVGILLYRMVVGQRPFSGLREDILAAHVNTVPPAPSASARVSDGYDRLVAAALAKSPDDRPESAETMAIMLRKVLDAGEPEKPSLAKRLFGRG